MTQQFTDWFVQYQAEQSRKQQEKIGETIYPIPGEFTELESCNELQLKSILEALKQDPAWFSETVTKTNGDMVVTDNYSYGEKEYFLSAEETKAEIKRLIVSAKETRIREYQLLDALMKFADSVEFQ